MFSGIIETIGTVVSLSSGKDSMEITLKINAPWDDIITGDSISVNGACLTVTSIKNNFTEFIFCLVKETLNKTSLSSIKTGSRVNLERSLLADKRIGGHNVQGHVDCTADITHIEKLNKGIECTFKINKKIKPYIIEKGYISLDGMSITIASCDENNFKVALIPHTLANTIAQDYQIGRKVNCEADIFVKTIYKMQQNLATT